MDDQSSDQSLTFLETVCLRPTMYTITGTLEEVICFLNGFYAGMTTHSRDPRAQALAQGDWFGFLNWIHQHAKDATHIPYITLYHTIKGDDQSGTCDSRRFQALYRQYKENIPNANNS